MRSAFNFLLDHWTIQTFHTECGWVNMRKSSAKLASECQSYGLLCDALAAGRSKAQAEGVPHEVYDRTGKLVERIVWED